MAKREGCLIIFGWSGRAAPILMTPQGHVILSDAEGAELRDTLKIERASRRELIIKKRKELKVV